MFAALPAHRLASLTAAAVSGDVYARAVLRRHSLLDPRVQLMLTIADSAERRNAAPCALERDLERYTPEHCASALRRRTAARAAVTRKIAQTLGERERAIRDAASV